MYGDRFRADEPGRSHAPPASESSIDRARAEMLRAGLVLNYRIEDFCACFGISRRMTYLLIERGDIEAIKAGGRTLITAESAKAWRDRCPRIKPGGVGVRTGGAGG